MGGKDNDLTCDVIVVGAGPAGENAADRQLPGALQAITSPLDVDAVLRRRDGFASG